MYKSFIDTNIWIYAFTETEKDIEKHSSITHFLEELKSKSNILISVQVLNEFHWTLKRKYKIEETAIREKVRPMCISSTESCIFARGSIVNC